MVVWVAVVAIMFAVAGIIVAIAVLALRLTKEQGRIMHEKSIKWLEFGVSELAQTCDEFSDEVCQEMIVEIGELKRTIELLQIEDAKNA